jgi:GT2 family glycosyltransferase
MTNVAAIIIGRNEGERLVACLASLGQDFGRVIYVDSGSTDGSVAAAQTAGAETIDLDISVPFTAARARNAGIDALKAGVEPDLVQFLDGDCILDHAWLAPAIAFLAGKPDIAAIFGRLRERFPQTSIYNRLCDTEWDAPIGEATACGGNALIRWDALKAVGGYNPGLIAGEEPEMCLRMRREGWKIWRLDAEMALHDAAITKFSQFWNRTKRTGYAFAEGAAMYGSGPERFGIAGTRRAIIWGLMLPFAIIMSVLLFGNWALSLLLVYPLQVVRLAIRDGADQGAWERAALLTIGKFAEALGVVTFMWRRLRGRQAKLIEYK